MALQGSEVKALRENKASLAEGYARFRAGELYLVEVHIGQYSHTGSLDHEARRPRKLLLNRGELRRIRKAAQLKGQTLIPLSIYFKHGRAKLELALCKGKQRHDRRREIARRDMDRQLERDLSPKNR